MKRVLTWGGIAAGVVGVGFGLMAAQYEPKTRANTRIESLDLSGLSRPEAASKLDEWWQSERERELSLNLPTGQTYRAPAAKLGLALDAEATLNQVEFPGLLASIREAIAGRPTLGEIDFKFRPVDADTAELEAFVKRNVPDRKPARVVYRGGAFQRTPEVAGFKFDSLKLFDAALDAFQSQESRPIPLVLDVKKVPDNDLEKIREVMSEFSTRFSEGKAARSSNIRLAARKIDGIVLAPGESFSFNGVVGRRTAAGGFKEAGVYKDGKHDVDIGGGICQVSTTLYNAALFANLKINKRQNHSMPVPYVPIGRDAAVDYGRIDLAFTNTLDVPIAVNSEVQSGKITFRILGIKDPSISVKIESFGARSWAVGEKLQPDPNLPEGKRKVIEKGSAGYAINTARVVYRDGRELRREPLGQSHYRGGKRIVAVGTSPIAPETPSAMPVSAELPPDESDD